jgi:TatA/E family protein of Tat protein translocase
MNLFGVGPTEIFVVLIIILVLFGPDKLPEMAKRIGGASRELRDSLDSLSNQMNDVLENSMELDKAKMIPPAESLPGENPPVETMPADSLPAENPPAETTPAGTLPAATTSPSHENMAAPGPADSLDNPPSADS